MKPCENVNRAREMVGGSVSLGNARGLLIRVGAVMLQDQSFAVRVRGQSADMRKEGL